MRRGGTVKNPLYDQSMIVYDYTFKKYFFFKPTSFPLVMSNKGTGRRLTREERLRLEQKDRVPQLQKVDAEAIRKAEEKRAQNIPDREPKGRVDPVADIPVEITDRLRNASELSLQLYVQALREQLRHLADSNERNARQALKYKEIKGSDDANKPMTTDDIQLVPRMSALALAYNGRLIMHVDDRKPKKRGEDEPVTRPIDVRRLFETPKSELTTQDKSDKRLLRRYWNYVRPKTEAILEKDEPTSAAEVDLAFTGNAAAFATELRKTVQSQDLAVEQVAKSITTRLSGWGGISRPLTLLIPGPSGYGKTTIVTAIGRTLFGPKIWEVPKKRDLVYLKIDLSNYSHKDDISRLIGSSSGLIGSDEPGLLIQFLQKVEDEVMLASSQRSHKITAILHLEEIDKANSAILTTLMELLDRGEVRAANGARKLYAATRLLIIMTSNLAEEVLLNPENRNPANLSTTIDSVRARALSTIANGQASVLGRIGEIVLFFGFTAADARLAIGATVYRLLTEFIADAAFLMNMPELTNVLFRPAESFLEFLMLYVWEPTTGVRSIESWLRTHLSAQLSQTAASFMSKESWVSDQKTAREIFIRFVIETKNEGPQTYSNFYTTPDNSTFIGVSGARADSNSDGQRIFFVFQEAKDAPPVGDDIALSIANDPSKLLINKHGVEVKALSTELTLAMDTTLDVDRTVWDKAPLAIFEWFQAASFNRSKDDRKYPTQAKIDNISDLDEFYKQREACQHTIDATALQLYNEKQSDKPFTQMKGNLTAGLVITERIAMNPAMIFVDLRPRHADKFEPVIWGLPSQTSYGDTYALALKSAFEKLQKSEQLANRETIESGRISAVEQVNPSPQPQPIKVKPISEEKMDTTVDSAPTPTLPPFIFNTTPTPIEDPIIPRTKGTKRRRIGSLTSTRPRLPRAATSKGEEPVYIVPSRVPTQSRGRARAKKGSKP